MGQSDYIRRAMLRFPPTSFAAGLCVGLLSCPALAQPAPKKAAGSPRSEVAAYCTNIAATATDVRIAWEMKQLEEVEAQAKAAMEALEAKRKDVQDRIDRLDELKSKANDDVVAIFGKMPAESASSQLVEMDETAAASILRKLNPRLASGILAEMDSSKAARLSDLMISGPDGKKS